MAKDPAFLWYSKDWFSGTAEWSLEEKGAMAELMSYQHLNGSIPADESKIARLLRVSMQDFERIWKTVGDKFKPSDVQDRLENQKLSGIMDDRAEKAHRNKITGTFAGILRGANLSQKQYKEVRKSFSIDDFIETPTERLTETITEWLSKCLKSIEDGNANGNGNEDVNENTIEDADKDLRKEMRMVFLQSHKRKKGTEFYWTAKDSVAVKGVVPKIRLTTKARDGDTILAFWKTILENLPDWYFQNGFTPSVINSKYNEIINKIHKPNATNNTVIDRQVAAHIQAHRASAAENGTHGAGKKNQPA